MNRTIIVLGAIVALSALSLIGHHVVFATQVNLLYHREVASHVDLAYDYNTPDAILRELSLAERGMRRLGLTEDEYGAYWSWEQTPDRSMATQYDYLHQVQARVRDVWDWLNKTRSSGQQESLGDVYESKVDNIRDFMHENGRLDWISVDAYYANQVPYWYNAWIVQAAAILALIASAILLLIDYEDGLDPLLVILPIGIYTLGMIVTAALTVVAP